MRILFAFLLTALVLAPGSAHAQQCAQPLSSGAQPTASDCLFILKAAVGTEVCQPECVCVPSGSLPIKATDALLCLNAAVGAPVSLDCPCEPTTTSTTVSTTTTTITLPPGDTDNDGLLDADDPCPDEALNRCAGTVATDEASGRPIRLNAGTPEITQVSRCHGQRLDCNGDVWEADFGANTRRVAFACDLPGDGCDIKGIDEIFGCSDENTADIFRCEHWADETFGGLDYSFDVPNGGYIVNLLFANVAAVTTKVGSRLFDVAIESELVLDDFDQVAAAGASGRALIRSIPIDVTDGDGLQIEFITVKQNPAIKGIEVLAID
jgi:hypothetical protein